MEQSNNPPGDIKMEGMSLWLSNNPTLSGGVWIDKQGSNTINRITTFEEIEKFSISKEKISATGGGKGDSSFDRARWNYSVSIDVPFTKGR